MRRLLRWLFNGLCLVSLLACIGSGWLWWRSYRAPATVEFDRPTGRWRVASDAGRVWVDNAPQLRRDAEPVERARAERAAAEERFYAQLNLARGYAVDSPEYTRAATELDRRRRSCEEAAVRMEVALARRAATPGTGPSGGSVSHAVPLAALALPPSLWLALRSRRLIVRRRRRRLGLCLRCGYDLRGNTSGKCSECGEKVEAVTTERTVTA